jgi:hypothetical protein
LVERNRIWTVVKTFPWYLALLSPMYSLARYGMGLCSLLSGKGSVGKFTERHSAKDLFLAVARAYADGLKGIPEMLRKRRILRAGQTVGDREFVRMLRRFQADVREVAFNE